MAKEATLQVRMDADLKEKAEAYIGNWGHPLQKQYGFLQNRVCWKMGCHL